MANRTEHATTRIAKLAAGGRIVLPSPFRKSLGVKPGDEVVMVLEQEQVRLFSRQQARKRAQDLVAKLIPRETSLADELIAERRKEASRE